jgi:chemotaxis protein methyltransferase CheR
MADVMVEGGYLYIGHSENLNQLSDQYTLIGKTLYQKI